MSLYLENSLIYPVILNVFKHYYCQISFLFFIWIYFCDTFTFIRCNKLSPKDSQNSRKCVWFLAYYFQYITFVRFTVCQSERERERSGVKMFDLLLIWSFHIFIQASIYNIILNICTTSTKCVIIWSSQLNCI